MRRGREWMEGRQSTSRLSTRAVKKDTVAAGGEKMVECVSLEALRLCIMSEAEEAPASFLECPVVAARREGSGVKIGRFAQRTEAGTSSCGRA